MNITTLHTQFRTSGTWFTIAAWLTLLTPLLLLTGKAPGDIAISLIACCFVAHSIHTRNAQWLQHTWVRVLIMLWVYMCINSLFAENIATALGRSAAWLRYPVGAVALAYWLLPHAILRKTLVGSLSIALAFLLFDGFFQYVAHVDLVGRAMLDYGQHFRLTGPFSAPRIGITMVWLILPAASVWLHTAHTNRWRRMAGIALMALTMLLIYISGERMAFIFMLFAAGLWCIFCPALRVRMLQAVALAGCLIVALTSIDSRLSHRQVDATGDEIAGFGASPYGKAWKSATAVIAEHPLFGVGAKQFQSACYAQHHITEATPLTDITCPMHAHNFYLEWLVEYGVVGLSLFLVCCWQWVRLAWKHRHIIRISPLLSALLITLIIRFWPLASTASQFVAWSAVPLWLMVGWLIAELRAREESDADRSIAR